MSENSSNLPATISIDGPAASGKSTVGYELAQKLGYLYLDTGSMYRAATLAAILAGIDPHDEEAVTALASDLDLAIQPAEGATDGRQYTVLLDGRDVTWALRSPEVDRHVSTISTYQGVRQEMVSRQRAIAKQQHVVMVGRDIGTVVLPTAPLKLYITASAEERAHRRCLDRRRQGHEANYEEILAGVNERDRLDSSREHSPLRPADDAIIIDNTGKSPQEVMNEILAIMSAAVHSPERQTGDHPL